MLQPYAEYGTITWAINDSGPYSLYPKPHIMAPPFAVSSWLSWNVGHGPHHTIDPSNSIDGPGTVDPDARLGRWAQTSYLGLNILATSCRGLFEVYDIVATLGIRAHNVGNSSGPYSMILTSRNKEAKQGQTGLRQMRTWGSGWRGLGSTPETNRQHKGGAVKVEEELQTNEATTILKQIEYMGYVRNSLRFFQTSGSDPDHDHQDNGMAMTTNVIRPLHHENTPRNHQHLGP